ncbi:MAG: glycerophosphodiester phosphodiesterase family protein [Clostridia bacterium]|nr:glycerophosphodiester phosphodiesterase family protein [Clostridia bacterium]
MKRYTYNQNHVLVSGHRGVACYGFENTMEAFRMALDMGVDMIETDVHMTKDGALVLMHDESVDRTTDGSGLISQMTLAEIKRLNAHVHATIQVASESPPTLEEFLKLMQGYPRVLLNIELKDYPTEGKEAFAYRAADVACEALLAYGVADRTWINSFSGKLLEHVYLSYGNTFYYHGFYPWFILGEMTVDPESFIDVACMQHCVLEADGTIRRCADNMCPKEWFDHLLSRGIMPLMAPSLREYPLYDLAFSYGSRIVNPDDPEAMLRHLKEQGMHP